MLILRRLSYKLRFRGGSAVCRPNGGYSPPSSRVRCTKTKGSGSFHLLPDRSIGQLERALTNLAYCFPSTFAPDPRWVARRLYLSTASPRCLSLFSGPTIHTASIQLYLIQLPPKHHSFPFCFFSDSSSNHCAACFY
ncbi:hypothetical protein BDQ94DRAFT_71043 [Aspergillus welwitschiae]|uniref:Uncharacterized protein n=1 Tax=Aspergillus welwitschiae TaxID=1341132 RepID=A0A3F3QGW3_9EURO|nr:hypothetical protein BDQ94DRAFT_71043 [Aspergillus welwitschiae]RDH37896.1 hypothetical protein BDQ94DRAFT_71043 [Aspergillus welwitschiae]